MLRHRTATRLVLLSICILAFASSSAYAAKMHRAPKQVKEQIAELEEQWRTATLSGDPATMDRLLSDDYVGISWTGQVNTKATQLDRLRTRSLQITRMDLSDVKVKVVQSVAIVTCSAQIQGTSDGVPMNGTFRYTRVYQRLPGNTWKITNFEATRVPNRLHDHHGAQALPTSMPDTPGAPLR